MSWLWLKFILNFPIPPSIMNLKAALFFNLFLLNFQLLAQNSITGQLFNEVTDHPVEYANIFLLGNQSKGTFSNQIGLFQLSINGEQVNDTLVISQIGYETAYLPITKLGTDTNRIHLIPTAHDLGQVTVTDEETLKNFFKKAIQKIPEQYGDQQYMLKGYYQEYTISDYAFSELLEAFVTIQDQEDYNSLKAQCEIHLEAMRKSDDKRVGRTFGTKFNQLYEHYELYNYVRKRGFYPPSGNLGDKFFKKFTFRKLGEYIERGDTIVKISYENPKMDANDKDRSFATGEVLIRKSDYAILSIKRNAIPYGIFQETTYRKLNGKYFPFKVTTSLSNYHLPNRKHTQLNATTLLIYEVASIEQNGLGQLMDRKVNLRDHKLPYDPEFWDQNKIVLPVPASEVMKHDIQKKRSLEEQFKRNASRHHKQQ